MNKLIEGEDFYYNEQGYVVLTEKYHLINVAEPKRGELASPHASGGTKGGVQKAC
jgi:hypothetical protein